MVDTVVVGLRALSFVAALQAAGVPLFLCLFYDGLGNTGPSIRALGRRTALIGLACAIAYQLAAPARLTGDFTGILDGSLQSLLLASDAGTATGIRALGLAIAGLALLGSSRAAATGALGGGMLVMASFAFMGHTASDDQRWLLAGLLIVHLAFVAFWFGALWPLAIASRSEPPAVAGRLAEQFSRLAVWLVPGLFAAGLAMAVILLWRSSRLLTPYGWSLLAKVSGFAMLMLLAGLNKWRLGPRMTRGDSGAVTAFLRSLQAEWVLIAGVLVVTAVMTSLFSPVH